MKRMLEAIRDASKGEESLKEINRRLQSLLEETLAKNMHLHNDVDNLTKQVQELTVLAATKASQDTDLSLTHESVGVDVTEGFIN